MLKTARVNRVEPEDPPDSPSFFHDELNVRITRPLAGGLFAALVAFTAGASQLVLRRRISRRLTTGALLGVIVGMGMIAASSFLSCLAVAIVGGLIAGVGAGIAQMNAMAAVQGLMVAALEAGNRVVCVTATRWRARHV